MVCASKRCCGKVKESKAETRLGYATSAEEQIGTEPHRISHVPWKLTTPVILLVFNRPALTRKLLERVALARPGRLLIVADGPRPDRVGEASRCEEVRRIASEVSWPCEVMTNFAPENLGCRARIVSGLNWAFSHVEEAIVLEDDILPDLSFFRFCQEMLERYRDDPRVNMITGFNHGADRAATPYSYFFSELTHIWGWATWKRAWQHYDEQLSTWPEVRASGLLGEIFPKKSALRYWTTIFDSMHEGTGPNTWDYQWMYTNLCRRALAITPGVNLVENGGFGEDGTHVTNPKDAPRVQVASLEFPLRHPPAMIASRSMDELDQQISGWHVPALPKRAWRKLGRIRRRLKVRA